jgi:DNA-binding NarL/FixJ family response regulator
VTVRVVVADDEPLVCAGLGLILDADPDIVVVDQASGGRTAVDAARRHRPDVVVLDIRMPDLDGITATRRIRAGFPGQFGPAPGILLLTTFDTDEAVQAGLRSGASGFLFKHAVTADLVAAVKAIAAGHGWLDPTIIPRTLAAFGERTSPAAPSGNDPAEVPAPELALLTPREQQVLRLLAEGRSNHELAEELVLATATVKNHVSRILTKLGVRDRTQATAVAHHAGWLRPAPERRPRRNDR